MNNTDDNRNTIYMMIGMMVLLFAYQIFYVNSPQQKAQRAAAAAAAAASSSSAAALASGVPQAGNLTVEQARARSARVPIDTPSLKGSIALTGALFDDLYLAKYRQTTEPNSPLVELLRPAGADHAYYEESGFTGQNLPNLPGSSTVWQLVSGDTLSVGKPVVLGYDNGAGLQFRRTINIDDNYMISVDDTVSNTGTQAVSLTPYSWVTRIDMPATAGKSGYVQEGGIATFSSASKWFGAGKYETQSPRYKNMADDAKKNKPALEKTSAGGWVAIDDKYWMAAVIPDQKANIHFKVGASIVNSKPVFQSGYNAAAITVAPGQSQTVHSHIFAGAKVDTQLRAYEKTLAIPRFHNAMDWGVLEIIAYPFYLLLTWLYGVVHNYGLAILCLTVIVKAVFYPLAHRSYEQMTKMKHVQQRLQPKLDAIKKRFPDDPQKQQEATMQLYQEEKVNPMAGLGGCLPMLLQLPVFILLVKVLQLDINLYHAPFFGWIKDLSAPDPLSITTLFGLLHYDPATVPLIGGILNGPLHIGPVAILYGASMWASQQMTPMAGIDPAQKKMMAFMPLMMVFFFSSLAIGLMIYYFWSNILTMAQQYSIMRRLKVDNPIDELIVKVRGLLEKKAA
ncbi:MAG: membrane protein insertase YidC [Asticcacaulis sp.]